MTILDLDATALASEIAARNLSSLEAVNTYINRLEKINPYLNCLVEKRFGRAGNEAQNIDEQLKTKP